MVTKFGKLTVIEERWRQRDRNDRPGTRKVKFWLVQCSCGSKPFELSDYKLRHGSQACRSCTHSGDNNSKKSHGESGTGGRQYRSSETPEYRCWKTIKNRCYNQNFKQYSDYGGRGIRVCQRWLDSYADFLADMGRKPSSLYSIQRRDNDGDYTPSNCFWATDKEQRRNKRTTRLLTARGKTQSRIDWIEELGLSENTFDWRSKQGWSDEEILFGRC